MAGYHIYSLSWARFRRFVDDPTPAQLRAFAELVSEGLDEADGDFEADDPLRDWPSDPAELAPIVRGRLGRPDWYGDLSYPGKVLWQHALYTFCDETHARELGFRVESDPVYWDVIDSARGHYGDFRRPDPGLALARFGERPFRYEPPAGTEGESFRNHSMHPPQEVVRLRDELRAAEPTVRAAARPSVPAQFDILLPAVARVARGRRLLFIGVDT